MNENAENLRGQIEAIEKVSTGSAGLDQVLGGGLPKGRPTALIGASGTGKTVLIYSFICGCLARDEPVVIATFEERPQDFRRHARAFGIHLEDLESRDLLAIVDATLPLDGEDSEGFDVEKVFANTSAACERLNAQHLIVEGFDVFTGALDNPILERQEYYDLRTWSLTRGVTALYTVKSDRHGNILPPGYSEFVTFWSDCHLYLDSVFAGHASVRRLEVQKYRGSDFRSGRHLFHIGRRGFMLAPLAAVDLPAGMTDREFSAGSEALDRILGGGILEGSINVITGSDGAGRTVFLSMISLAALARGERVLRLNLETATRTLFRSMRRAGLDLETPERNGLSETIAVLPDSVSSEELLFKVIDRMEAFKPSLLVFESLSAASRLGDADLAMSFIVRLIGAARSRGVTVVCSNSRPHHASRGLHMDVPSSSALFDTIVDIHSDYLNGSMVRSLAVVKALGADHSRRVHRFEIDASGLHIQDGTESAPR